MSPLPELDSARSRSITKLLRSVRLSLGFGIALAQLPGPRAAAQEASSPPAAASLLADSSRLSIEAAFAAGRPDAMVSARAIVERGLQQDPTDALLLHYRGYAYFREAQLREGDAARRLFELARAALERSIAVRDLSESRALLSATLGNLIGGSPFRAIRFGRASLSAIDQAIALGPDNPRAWMLKGVGMLMAPSMFGGGTEKAEAALRKAAGLFAADTPASPLPAWGEVETRGWLAITLVRQKKAAEALVELERGLALDGRHAFLLQRAKPAVDSLVSSRAP